MRTVFSRNSDITGQQRAALADASSAASLLAVAESVTVVEIGCSFTRAVVRRRAIGPSRWHAGSDPSGVASCQMWPVLMLISGFSWRDSVPQAEPKGCSDAAD